MRPLCHELVHGGRHAKASAQRRRAVLRPRRRPVASGVVQVGATRPDRRSDDGVASVQSAVLYPLVLLLIVAIVQGVVYLHAQNVALSVANGAVQVVRVEGGTVEDGYADAGLRLGRAGILAGGEVHIVRGAETVDVTVRGLAPSLLPGVRGLSVERTATGPVEHFTEVAAG